MHQVLLYSVLLVAGLAGSQLLPIWGGAIYAFVQPAIQFLTLVALSFIMIRVGREFELDRTNLRQYGWDYVVAMTAAAFPWILVTFYFLFVLLPPGSIGNWEAWKETALAGRFAAPTSAGVLFSMLVAAGLGTTWLYRKAHILAIFDDLDTVLLMIPLKMAMVGLAWQLGVVVLIMLGQLWIAWRYLRAISLPSSWPWILGYASLIAGTSEVLYQLSLQIDPSVPVHIEVLLPAFVLGCVLKHPEGHDHHVETPLEIRVATIISAIFMVLVGLSMPQLTSGLQDLATATTITAQQPPLPWSTIAWHVLAVTILSNLGKMYPAFTYHKEAHWRERLALAIGMWPRGEVGAGVLLVSVSYGIGGPIVTIAVLSLALNLLLTGVFILMVRRLLDGVPQPGAPGAITRTTVATGPSAAG